MSEIELLEFPPLGPLVRSGFDDELFVRNAPDRAFQMENKLGGSNISDMSFVGILIERTTHALFRQGQYYNLESAELFSDLLFTFESS